ncbi:unnamed protein product [Debaryomyces fabryi]|nr:unnamed protein product [Debaryomyces fabryi]
MATNSVVIGSIIGAVIGTCFLLIILMILYCYWCCVVYVNSPQDEYNVSELHFRDKQKTGHALRNMLSGISWIFCGLKRRDLEDQIDIDKPPSSVTNCETNLNSNSTSSRLALKSYTLPSADEDIPQVCMGNVKDVNIIPCLNKDDATSYSLVYKDAIDRFDLSDGLVGTDVDQKSSLKAKRLSDIRRMSSLTYRMDDTEPNNYVTTVSKPSESERSYISDQYDSFTRTLMLQNLIGNSINTTKKNVIKELYDPYLENLISVGGIVVVVKLFNGVNDFEFDALEIGDLLRIVRFYVKGDIDINKSKIRHDDESIDIAEFQNDSSNEATIRDGICVGRSDPNYDSVYCTGILLNTYLEYNKQTCDLSLRLKKGPEVNEYELLKDFPLNIVSLETTVLKKVSESSVAKDKLENHFC